MARETTRKTASEVWQEAKNEQFAQDVKKVNSDYLAMYDKAVSGFVNNSRKNSPYDPYRSRSLAQEALSDIAYREQVIEAYYEKNRRRLGEDQYSAGLRKLASNRSSAQKVMGAYNAAAAFYPQQQKVDDYLERAMSYYNSAQTDLDSMTWANASDVYGRRSSAADALKAENDDFLEWIEKNRVTLGEQNYNSLKQQFEDIGSGYDDVVSAFGNNADFYGQFDTEEDYLKWDAYSQKYSGKSYNELLSLLPDIKDEEEREWVSQYSISVMTKSDYDASIEKAAAEIDSLEKVIDEYNSYIAGYGMGGDEDDKRINSKASQFLNSHGFSSIKEAERRLEELKTTQWDLSNRKKYAFLDTNQDFDTIAGDIADSRTAGFGIGFGTNWWGFGDPVYDYINDIDGTRKEYVDTSDVQHPYTIYDMMYDDEIMKYNYLYNTEGKDSADKYLDYLEYTLNKRRMGIARENAAILANKHPFAASALSVPYNLVSGIGFADIAGQNLLKNIAEGLTGEYIPVDYNSGAMGATVFNSTVRGTVAQNIANKHGVIELDKQAHPILSKVFNGKSLGDVYQLGMSMADSATTALLAPVIGTGATALLGGSAASQGVLDAVSRGATDEQALMMGIVNGACEMFFEKYSLEQLLKGDTRNIVMAFLKQGFAEGSEEFNTTVANNLADIFIMAKNSGYQRNVDKYIDQGLSPEEAEKMAFWDAAIQAGWDFVGGFASGGIMGSVSTPIHNYQNQNAEAFRIYGADPGALVSEALEIDPDNAYAQKMQNRLEAGKQLSGGQLNRLVKQNEAALSAQDIYTIQSAAEARLTDLGETGDVSSIAAALTKQAAGRKLTRAEQKVIENSKYGQRVANELNTDNIQSGGFSSAWVENIGTNRINAQEYNRPAEAAQLPQKAVKNTGYSKMLSPKSTPVEAPAETVPANRDSADDIDGLETTYAVSEDGRAHLISNPEQSVDIVGFDSIKNGKAMLRTSDGEVVPADDVSYANESQAIVFETIANMGIKAKSANILLQGFLGKEGIDAEAYARGLLEAFEYGKTNRNTSGMSFSSALTPAQLDYVYRQGRKAAKKQTGREQARMIQTVERARAVIDQRGDSANAEYTVILEDGLTEEEMTPSQKASYEMIRHIPAAMKGNVRIYDGKTGEFGYYDPNSGDIYLNINSTRSQKSMMAFAMGHELVHRAKDGSPAKYQKFADFLIEQYGKQRSDVEAMIAEQKQAAKDHGLELTDEQAFDEVVADACQRMLLDTNAGQRLAEFGVQSKQNQSIVQDVIQWIRDILEKLRNIFADVDPDSLAAQEFAKFDAGVKQILADMYVDMTIDAGENLSVIKKAFGSDTQVSKEEVLKHYGHEYRPSGELGERALYKLPVSEDTSPRALLTNALDTVITDPVEKQKLQEYRENIEKLNEQEDKLRDLKSQIKDLSFAPGPRDTQKIKVLREEAAKTENRINIYDKRLLRFEASSTLQKVLQREKAKVAEREKAKRIKGKEDYQRGEEVKLAELIRKYRATREALTQQKRDTTTMEAEFIRLVKQYEKLSAKSNASNKTSKDKLSDLRTALKEEAKAHKDDQKQWEKEFDRLLKEYEHSEKRIDLLEAKIKAQRKSASARVDSRNRTEMRKKIRRVIRDLDKLLNRGTKKQNVKEGMRDFVAASLASAEALFTETYTTDDMINYGVETDTTTEERKLLAMAKRILDQISNLPKVADVDDVNALMKQEADLKKELSAVKSQLKGVFERERYRMSGFTASKLFGELANSYANLAKSGDNYISGAYREEIYQRLLETQTAIGAVRVADMSLEQLDMVYDSYAMVLQAVRDANKMFVFGRNVTRDDLARSVLSELKNAIKTKKNSSKAGKLLNSFAWNNLKPIYAFERIGSSTLAELYANIRKGQDVWALDMREARKFRREIYKKYGRKKWNFKKTYDFTSSTGKQFSLTLDQIMSIYAYYKREQSRDHLLKGGIVFDKNTEVTEYVMGVPVTRMLEDATAYKLSLDTLEKIVGELNDQQKSFVNDLQTYLSKTMGNKGNDVSMQLYGIKLFKEENYFPIKSAGQYMEKTREANLQKEQGQINLVNAGFAKSTVPDASNPIVLSGFMETWANHVAEMSMYHAFVLPMEDFRRVYDFSTPNLEGEDSDSVYAAIQNAHGTAATAYIDQLYRDLNGGVVADPRENIAKKMIGLFKQGAVMASSSVGIQQPSALVRSFAMIDPKYFGALPIVRGAGRVLTDKVHHQHQQLWEELKKYAPVAMIKEMGYFDTGMGRSAVDFLLTEEYHGFGEKAKGFFTDSDYRGEVLSKAAAKADELTWIQIWIAVKNETADRNPGMNRNSEEFLKIAGKRFSEVIDRTQVYDSVFARSGNMRSKSVFMNIATAFKAEPTTSINMIEDAIRKFGKGYKGQAARTIGAVFLNILLNSALVSLIYAARDDDEDETYLEKYVSSFVTESMDGLNPMTYYPFLNDVWSILQGYDVERADLSLVTDVVDVMKNLVKLHGKDTSDMDEEEISEHNKKIQNEWLKALDGMTAFMGLPVKNVRRDFNGAINMYKTLSADFGGRTTTIQSIGDVLQSDVSKSVPVLGWLPQKTKADKLFDALVSGDTAYIDRLKATYKDEDAYKSAIRTVIGERFVNGKIGANEASRYLVLHGGLDGSEARGYIDEWSMEIDVGIVYDDLRKQFVDQKVTESEAVDYLVKYGGKREEDAEKTVREWGLEKDTGIPYAKMKEVFLDRGISESEAVDYMVEYGGKKRDAAEETVNKWRLELETGIAYDDMKTKFIDEDISESEAVDYMVEYGGKKQKDAEAIIKQWTFEKDTGIPYDDMKTAFLDEKISESEAIKYRVEYGGAKQKDAEKTISLWKFEAENTWDYENRKSLYLDGEISAATLKKALIEFGDYDPEDADLQVKAYDWEAEGYGNITTEAVRDYNEYCAAANVPKGIYMHIRKFANSTENDVVNGEKVPYSAVKKIMREINSQTGLTSAQKTAIARSIGWKDSTIEKYKLW